MNVISTNTWIRILNVRPFINIPFSDPASFQFSQMSRSRKRSKRRHPGSRDLSLEPQASCSMTSCVMLVCFSCLNTLTLTFNKSGTCIICMIHVTSVIHVQKVSKDQQLTTSTGISHRGTFKKSSILSGLISTVTSTALPTLIAGQASLAGFRWTTSPWASGESHGFRISTWFQYVLNCFNVRPKSIQPFCMFCQEDVSSWGGSWIFPPQRWCEFQQTNNPRSGSQSQNQGSLHEDAARTENSLGISFRYKMLRRCLALSDI